MVVRGFESYAHEDEELRDQLDTHLASLSGRITVDTWHDRYLVPGDLWERELTLRQESARIQLLLISPHFFKSRYCQIEMQRALKLQEAGRARVIAIIVRPVDWADTPVARLQVLPRDGKPVTSWSNRDEAWLNVAQGIRAALQAEVAQSPEAPPGHAPPDPVRSLVAGLPRHAERDVSRFLGYYLGSGKGEGPIFGGRDAELETLDRWLEEPSAPQCLFVTGPGGRGKSALLAHWVRRVSTREGLDIVFFPISVRFGTHRAGTLYHALAARLSYLRGKPFLVGQDTSSDILREVVSELLSHPARDRRLLVVIDALDESADLELDTSFFPIPIPEGVRFVLSARPRPGERMPWLRQLGWDQRRMAHPLELGRLDARGVADALAQLPPALDSLRQSPEFADALFQRSEGDPLVLRLYLDWLESHPEVSKPDQLPKNPGLDGFFQSWWDEQRRLWGPQTPEQEPRVQRLLALLSCALGPVTRQEFLHLLEEESGFTFDETLKRLSRLVIGDDERGYAFTHPGLGDYFQGKLSDRERSRYTREFLAWGEQAIQALGSGKLRPEEVPSYLVRYYAAHLERSGAGPELFLSLVSAAWYRASASHERTNAVFLEDVMRAWRAVRRHNREEVRAGKVPSLSDEIRCAAVRTSIHSLARHLTPFLISALAENKLWSLEVALAHARHEPKADIRGLGLLALARLTSEPARSEILREVIDTALAIDKRHTGSQALIELASQLSPELLQHAIARIEAFRNVEEAARTMAILAHHAPEWAQRLLVPRALEMTRRLGRNERLSVLSELGRRLIEAYDGDSAEQIIGVATTALDARYLLSLASDEDFPGVRENARALLESFWRSHAVTEVPDLPDSLPPATIQQLLTRVRATCSESAYATALEILASRMEGALLEEAVREARQISTPPVRSKLLAVLASRFPSPRRLELLCEAQQAAQSFADLGGVAWAMEALTSTLSEPRKHKVLRHALKSIRSQAPSRGRLLNLAALVGALPQPEREIVLEEVLLEAESAASPSDWVHVIEALGSAAKDPRLWSALERLGPLPPYEHKRILELAGRYLPEHWLQGALDFALEETAVSIDFLTVEKMAVLKAIAPRLSEGLQERAVKRLQAMRSGTAVECIEILGPYLAERLTGPLITMSQRMLREKRAFVLASLLPRLPEGEQAAVLQEAFQLVTSPLGNDYYYDHMRAFKALAPHLTKRMCSRSVEIVQHLAPPGRTATLITLAPFSPEAEEALRQHALADARAAENEGFRAGLLAQIGPWLTKPQALEAFRLAKQLVSPDNRTFALRGLLAYLPAPEQAEAVEIALRDATLSEYWFSRLQQVAPHAGRLSPQRLYPLLSDILSTSFSSVIRGEFYMALQVLTPVLHVLGGEEELVRGIQHILEVETWWA